MTKPIKYVVRLTIEERRFLMELINKGKNSKEKLNRARALLKADCGEAGENWDDEKIAEAFYLSKKTVFNVRKSLVEEGFEQTLNRAPIRNKRERIIEGEEEAYLIALACSTAPPGRSKWTLRLLADKMVELNYVEAISHETIRKALKKMS